MRRCFPSIAILLLAACGGPEPAGEAERAAAPENAATSEASDKIECAMGGAAELERSCTVERGPGPGGTILTLRGPNGGFRRLLITGDGRGVIAADGAEPALVTPIADDRIEVSIGGDRFRLPATVR
jgi:hypothetical protein